MKKCKVDKGVVTHVWPSASGRECPHGRNGKPFPDCIIDCPDEVQVHWRYDGVSFTAKPPKKVITPRRSALWDTLCEEIGIDPDEFMAKVMARKRAAKKAK